MVVMTTSRAHIALNANLLSADASYRRAGIHSYQYNLIAELPYAAPEFEFSVHVGEGQPPSHEALTVRPSRISTRNPLVRILWEQLAAPAVLRRTCAALAHGLAFSSPLLWNGPSVVTIPDLSFLRFPERLSASRRLYLAHITRLSARKADRIIAISESVKREIHALIGVPLSRIDVTLLGVTSAFHPLTTETIEAFRQESSLPDQFILYLGTLEPRKNLDTLVRAYAQLPQRKSVKLVLEGAKGWQIDHITELIEALDVKEDIITPGYIPGNLLPMWYNAALLFVYPSVYEGFGLPLLEAMAWGLPVIASPVGGIPEVVSSNENGLLIPPGDIQKLTEAMKLLIENETLRLQLGDAGRLTAERYDVKSYCSTLTRIYESIT